MDSFGGNLSAFLAILNPFALCLYLVGVVEDLDLRSFISVLVRACVLSLVVFWLFTVFGERLLTNVLHVTPEAMRAFSGVIFFMVGYTYVVKGFRAMELLRGSLDELPSAIALPYMIGAGTITQSVLTGKNLAMPWAMGVVLAGVLVSFVVVVCFKIVHDRMHGSREAVFYRYVNILARLNGLLIGAISVEMVVNGLRGLWRLGA